MKSVFGEWKNVRKRNFLEKIDKDTVSPGLPLPPYSAPRLASLAQGEPGSMMPLETHILPLTSSGEVSGSGVADDEG